MKKLLLATITTFFLSSCGDSNPNIFDATHDQLACTDYLQMQENTQFIKDQTLAGKTNAMERLEALNKSVTVLKQANDQTNEYIQQQINKNVLPATISEYYSSITLNKGFWNQVSQVCSENKKAAVAGVITNILIPIFEKSISKPRWTTTKQFEDNPEKYFDMLVTLMKFKLEPKALEWYTKDKLISETLKQAREREEIFIYNSFNRAYKSADIEYGNYTRVLRLEKEEKIQKKKYEDRLLNSEKKAQLRLAIKKYNAQREKLSKEFNRELNSIGEHSKDVVHAHYKGKAYRSDKQAKEVSTINKSFMKKYGLKIKSKLVELKKHIKDQNFLINSDSDFDKFKLDQKSMDELRTSINAFNTNVKAFNKLKTPTELSEYVK